MQYTLKKKVLHFITPFNSILAVLAVKSGQNIVTCRTHSRRKTCALSYNLTAF